MILFTAEDMEEFGWGIIDEGYTPTGCLVRSGLGEKEAEDLAELMNAVYDRVKADIENGYIKPKET